MDLYSSDYASIQEGNLRSRSIIDANRAIETHNTDIANQISQLKSQQDTANYLEGAKNATQAFWASGKLPDSVGAWKKWSSGETDFRGNPTSAAQKTFSDTAAAVQSEDQPQLTDLGDGIFESQTAGAQAALSEGSEGGAKGLAGFAGEAMKGAGTLVSAAQGGLDIYEDIKAGGISGDNWSSKTANVLQIGGSIADIGGTVMPPLAAIGGTLDIASAAFSEVGEEMDRAKQARSDVQLQASETQTQIAQSAPEVQVTGRVS